MHIPPSLSEGVRKDLKAARNEHLFKLPEYWTKPIQRLLRDPRDLPVAILLINIILLIVPGSYFVASARSHYVGAVYLLLNYSSFLQRYLVALLHVSEHRPIFKRDLSILKLVVTHVLAPLYGVPSGMYKLHHKVMHHVEGNAYPGDSSSTVCFQRDSLNAFLRHATVPHSSLLVAKFTHILQIKRYWARHAFCAWVTVPLYAWRKGRRGLFWECILSEAGYLIITLLAVFVNPVATLWLLIIPFFVTSLALMFGNWSQHIFVDVQDPQNVFKSAYNCVDCPDNQKTFNDGYHILHHLNSQTHWSELPEGLLTQWERHAKEKALTFVGIGFFDVGLQVMLGRLDKLATCCITGGHLGKGELIELMKSRLKPFEMQ